jgi:hypothetical protein
MAVPPLPNAGSGSPGAASAGAPDRASAIVASVPAHPVVRDLDSSRTEGGILRRFG